MKKTLLKKRISALLTICMLFAMIPAVSFADEIDEVPEMQEELTVESFNSPVNDGESANSNDTASPASEDVFKVGDTNYTKDQLSAAITAASDGGTLELLADYTGNINILAGADITIDGGKNILHGIIQLPQKAKVPDAADDPQNKVTVTVQNLTIDGDETRNIAIASNAAGSTNAPILNPIELYLTIENCTIKDFTGKAIYVTNSKKLDIKNSTFDNTTTGPTSSTKGDYAVDVNLCNITGAEITIADSVFTADCAGKAAIKVTQRGGDDDVPGDLGQREPAAIKQLTISNCDFSGITDYWSNVLLGTSPDSSTPDKAKEDCYNFPVTISGNKSAVAVGVRSSHNNETSPSGADTNEKAKNYFQKNNYMVPAGSTVVKSADKEFPAVLIGTTGYASFEAAIGDAKEGDKLTVLQKVTLANDLTIDKKVTITGYQSESYNEKDDDGSISLASPGLISVPAGKTLTIKTDVTFEDMVARHIISAAAHDNAGLLKVENGAVLTIKNNVTNTVIWGLSVTVGDGVEEGVTVNKKNTGIVISDNRGIGLSGKVDAGAAESIKVTNATVTVTGNKYGHGISGALDLNNADVVVSGNGYSGVYLSGNGLTLNNSSVTIENNVQNKRADKDDSDLAGNSTINFVDSSSKLTINNKTISQPAAGQMTAMSTNGKILVVEDPETAKSANYHVYIVKEAMTKDVVLSINGTITAAPEADGTFVKNAAVVSGNSSKLNVELDLERTFSAGDTNTSELKFKDDSAEPNEYTVKFYEVAEINTTIINSGNGAGKVEIAYKDAQSKLNTLTAAGTHSNIAMFEDDLTITATATSGDVSKFTLTKGGAEVGTKEKNTYTIAQADLISAVYDVDVTFYRSTGGGGGGGGTVSDKYTITTSAGEGGTITDKQTVERGKDVTIKITPDRGYKVKDVLVDGKSVGAVTSYTFENVTKNHKIEAAFEIDPDYDPSQDAKGGFNDVKSSDWFYNAVTNVVDYGIFNGTSATTFEPQTNMSRAMFVTALANAAATLELQTTGFNPSFGDVNSSDWFYSSVAWASAQSIVNGYSDAEFGPNDNVTREQMAVLLVQFADYAGIELASTRTVTFNDQASISDWASEAVAKAAAAGLISGYEDGSFKPQGTATRAEVASVFSSLIDNYLKNFDPDTSNDDKDETEDAADDADDKKEEEK